MFELCLENDCHLPEGNIVALLKKALRKLNGRGKIVPVEPRVCLTIPVGTHFQFRSFGYEALAAIGVTLPPWPGPDEAYEVKGKWESTVISTT